VQRIIRIGDGDGRRHRPGRNYRHRQAGWGDAQVAAGVARHYPVGVTARASHCDPKLVRSRGSDLGRRREAGTTLDDVVRQINCRNCGPFQDNAARFKTEEASLNRQVELLKKKVEFESQYAADSYNRLQALKQQLDALPRTSFTTTDVHGNRATRVEAQDKNKEDEIKRKIAIEESTLRRSAATKNAAVQQQEEAEHYRNNILPLKKKAAEQELKSAEASELKETAKKRQKQMVDVFDLMGDVADIANDALKDAAKKMEQLQQEARRLQETREDAAVDHLRRRGRGAAADRRERKITEKRRAAELEAAGMSPEEAKAQAAQERVDSRRGIRGAPARQFEGIDAFRRGSMTKPDFPALDNRRAPSASSRRVPTAADAPKAASPEAAATKESADRVVAAIDTLRTTLQPPVADKLKAA